MKKIFAFVLIFCAGATAAHAGQPFSGKVKVEDVRVVCDTVAGWQMKNFADVRHHTLDWTNGALYVGMFEWAELTGNQRIFDFLMGIGKKNNWAMYRRPYHADDICVGQTFIRMYEKYGDRKMLQPVMERAYYIANHPSKAPLAKSDKVGKEERWSWCDALFMAPPVYAALYSLTGDKVYVDYMDKEFRECADSLYDRSEQLWYRDCHRIKKREPNGAKQFWGRGNGWVFGGIPLILENLPADHPTRPFYERIFMEMAESVVKTQDRNGAWHASLLDPDSYPDPENSASSFFCYGLAWGIRHGYLTDSKYEKALVKGWKSLVSCVAESGKLGYVQPVGASPKAAGMDATDVYGVGAFLLAGTELTLMLEEK